LPSAHLHIGFHHPVISVIFIREKSGSTMTDCSFFKGIGRFTILTFIGALISTNLTAQVNKYVGTWTTSHQPIPGGSTVHMELQIGTPEKDIIYPASLMIKCDSFFASYNLFLVKKTYNQLGISIHKQPVSESPFSLGNYPRFMNNLFQYNKDDKKGISMSLQRLPAKIFYDEPDIFVDSAFQTTSALLKSFFLQAEINLRKLNTAQDAAVPKNANMVYTGIEFGLMDAVHVATDTIGLAIPFNKKNDSDTISLAFNGGTIVQEAEIKKKNTVPFLELVKGENVVVLFADNYGKVEANNGKAFLEARSKTISLDLQRIDPYATFVVARLIYSPVRDTTEKTYETNTFVPASMTVVPTRVTYDKISTDKILQRTTTVMGEMETKSAQITLALWDDALEDGDTISLNINGKWLVQSFSVKKATQFINVMLERGPNKITFIADNLGSVPPNTSVLEIIDGKKRRSFKIETTLTSNNAINIFYDFKP